MIRKNPIIKYFRQNEHVQAELLLLERVLDTSKQQFSFNHLNAANNLDDLDNLASSHFRQGRYAEAEPLYVRTLEICKQQFGPDHLITATYLNKLANVCARQSKFAYSRQGKFLKAKPLYEHALSIREQQLDANHPDIANTLNDLATMYFRQGKYAKAKPLYERALFIREKQRSPNYPEIQHIQEHYVAAVKLKYLKVLFYIFPVSATCICSILLFFKSDFLVWFVLIAATLLFRDCEIYWARWWMEEGDTTGESP